MKLPIVFAATLLTDSVALSANDAQGCVVLLITWVILRRWRS